MALCIRAKVRVCILADTRTRTRNHMYTKIYPVCLLCLRYMIIFMSTSSSEFHRPRGHILAIDGHFKDYNLTGSTFISFESEYYLRTVTLYMKNFWGSFASIYKSRTKEGF